MDVFYFEPRHHIHHASGILVTVANQDQAFQMMRRKAANGRIDRRFDIRGSLIDGIAGRAVRDFDLLELI
jgi:hypothetical protein